MQLPSLLWNNFKALGQEHIFKYWGALDDKERQHLVFQAQKIDLETLRYLLKELSHLDFIDTIDGGLEAPERTAHPASGGSLEDWKKAEKLGESLIQAQRIVALTVAGGQATRLGGTLPKGLLGVSPCRQKSLFQLFAEKLKAKQERYGVTIPWLIMTSPFNHKSTESFFQDNSYFGLGSVYFFEQSFLPVLSQEAKLLLETPCTIAMNPNGHGGVFEGLVKSGLLQFLKQGGYEHISYFQVDNPLVHCVDPVFLGFHKLANSSFSSKVLEKAYPEERVGVFCKKQGQLRVIEYSHFPKDKMNELDAEAKLKYRWSNTAIHILDLDFIEHMGLKAKTCLPYRHALKTVPIYEDEAFDKPAATKLQAVKFERFIFDALEYARNPMLLEVLREEEFSPIKNYTGKDSLETAQLDQVKLFKSWLRAAGEPEGLLDGIEYLEISPLFADTKKSFIERWQSLSTRPKISNHLYLE